MLHSLRIGTAFGFLGCVTMGLVLPSCTNRLGPVRATQSAGGMGRPNLPDIVIEHSVECMEVYARQFEPGRVVLESTVEVNEDGDKVGVTMGGIPETAPDFGACLRNVLRNMPIAEQPLHEAVETLKFHLQHASDSREALNRFIEVIPGVPIVDGKVVLEAEGYTVVLPVTVKVVGKQVKQIDLDKTILAQIGQMALDSVGYEEIMRQAKEQGWVKTVRKIQPKAPAGKGLIAQSETEVVVVMFEVFTEYAVTAGVVSQLDSPLPGPADLAAIGIMAVGLCKVGALALNALSTPTAPAPTSSPPPPQVPPPPPPPPPRKYPNQTCEEAERIRLNQEMHKICDKGFAATCGGISENKLKKIPCSAIKLSIQQRQACLAARWVVQDKCFGGKPDDIHKKPIDEHQGGLDNCEALKLKNCAKGHPMADK